tara:strand:- start:137 stop:358 length:222 start_codon:yes stop_codon:yes gene_type:complete
MERLIFITVMIVISNMLVKVSIWRSNKWIVQAMRSAVSAWIVLTTGLKRDIIVFLIMKNIMKIGDGGSIKWKK